MRRTYLAATLVLLLGGCTAWPTVIDNRAGAPIVVRYHQQDYAEWSAEIEVLQGQSTRLARAHWIQDILGLEIHEGQETFLFTYEDLADVREACHPTSAARELTQPNCYLNYSGKGRITGTTAPQEDRLP